MRGYRVLKVSNQIGRIEALKEDLTNTKLNQMGRCTSKLIFGTCVEDVELIIRQYLLRRVADVKLNKALLFALGKPGSDVVHPLPPEWQKILGKHGFRVAKIRSTLAWNWFCFLFLGYGFVCMLRRLSGSVREIIRPQHIALGRYVYFEGLTEGNLPQPNKDHRSHDVITWYEQWSERVSELDNLCHSVRDSVPRVVGGLPVVSISSAIVPLVRISALISFIWWCFKAGTLAVFDLLRGRWWHALMLGEASFAATIREQDPSNLARDYMFHSTTFMYRPLWTYEAEMLGSQVKLYFYHALCEDLKRPSGYPNFEYGWQSMSWPHYLVWDTDQADSVHRIVGERASISVVGSIWFHTSAKEMPRVPLKTIAVFDVQPVRDSTYQTFCKGFDYSTPKTANPFLLDIYQTMLERGGTLALKRKREIGRSAHPKYRYFLEKLDKLPNFISVDTNIAASRLIEDSCAVISRPFTSTGIIARELGKPSIYYDPHGLIQKDDRSAHGIEVLCGPEELRHWLSAVLEKEIVREDSDV